MDVLDCENCLKAGHVCKGTHTTDKGKPTCVFCLDGEPCPVMKRTKPLAPASPAEKGKLGMTTKVATDNSRKCAADGCNITIRESNRSGFCHDHFHFSKRKAHPTPRSERSAGRPPRVNGKHHQVPTKPSNRHTSQIELSISEDQVMKLFLRIPPAERAGIVLGWLTGTR